VNSPESNKSLNFYHEDHEELEEIGIAFRCYIETKSQKPRSFIPCFLALSIIRKQAPYSKKRVGSSFIIFRSFMVIKTGENFIKNIVRHQHPKYLWRKNMKNVKNWPFNKGVDRHLSTLFGVRL